MKLKTMYIAKDMRVLKPSYLENYDKIKWEKPRKNEKREKNKSA